MPRHSDDDPGSYGIPFNLDRDDKVIAEIAARTKLRTLRDMSEREIRALERQYGCLVIRPKRSSSTRRTAKI